MPTYSYTCGACGEQFDISYKTLPQGERTHAAPCQCGTKAARDLGRELREGPPMVNGGMTSGLEKEMAFSMRQDAESGQSYWLDVNGHRREMKSAADVEAWRKQNAVGLPRMVEYTNPVTGQKAWTPMRKGGLKLDEHGQPMDSGPIVRESAQLVPLPKSFDIPSESRSGLPLKNGVLSVRPEDMKVPNVIEPETGKAAKLADLWGDDGNAKSLIPNPKALEALREKGT